MLVSDALLDQLDQNLDLALRIPDVLAAREQESEAARCIVCELPDTEVAMPGELAGVLAEDLPDVGHDPALYLGDAEIVRQCHEPKLLKIFETPPETRHGKLGFTH